VPDLDCCIYVNYNSRDRLMERLSESLDTEIDPEGLIRYGVLEIEWSHNDYESGADRDSFLSWYSLLEVQPVPGASADSVAGDLRYLLQKLGELGYTVAPECEDDSLLG
jgi:hypothetical protein